MAEQRLPDTWCRPRPDLQKCLFGEPTDDVLASLQVSRDDVRLWKERGWVSFDVDRYDELEMPFAWEIQFVRDVARSGLSLAQIRELLISLDKPYRFDPDWAAYSFRFGWVCPARQDPDEIVDEHLNDWLESLAEGGEQVRLAQLRDRITELLEEDEEDGT